MEKIKLNLLLFIFLIIIIPINAKQFPDLSAEFYGTVTINWTEAYIGANVTAYDPDRVLCGRFVVSNQGYYGSLSCNADYTETATDEGAQLNDNITFYVDGQRAVMFGNKSWRAGSFKEVNLFAQNFAPTFDHSLNHQYVNESSLFLYDINCSDLNYWDDISYYDNSTFFIINLTTGVINWTPEDSHVGDHTIKITCSDGLLNTSRILNITVIEIEKPPILDFIGDQIAVEGEVFTLDINATDPDNDTLVYSTNTTLFTIDTITGLISFTPTLAQVGNYSINISVSDSIFTDSETISFRIVRGPYCGDGSCGSIEDCSTCPSDCGVCPSVPSQESIVTEQDDKDKTIRRRVAVCDEKWECTEWSDCNMDGYQTRRCIDINKCGTQLEKPTEVRKCLYEGTCSDGTQNCHHGLCEEGIDCDGPCKACPAEPSCFDGIKNCHDGSCEEGIDCGGPCVGCEIRKYATIPVDLEKLAPVIRKYPWIFLMLISTIMTLTMGVDRIYVRKISKKEFAEYRKKMKHYKKIRAKLYFTATFISILIFIISFYIYLLSGKKYLMLLAIWSTIGVAALVLISTPSIISKFRYHEYRKHRKEKRLLETDKIEKENLVGIEDEILSKLELKTGKKIYTKIKAKELPKELIEPLTYIYKLLFETSNKRNIRLKPLSTEDKTKKLIAELGSETILESLAKEHPQFKDILSCIKSLNNELSKRKINDELIEKIINGFFISVSEVVIDKHLISVVRSDERLIDVYNEIVDVYQHYNNQLENKQITKDQLTKLESDFRKKIEEISNNPFIIEKIKKNNLEFTYNNLVDLYTHYKKKEEIYNELKELERKEVV